MPEGPRCFGCTVRIDGLHARDRHGRPFHFICLMERNRELRRKAQERPARKTKERR